MKKEVFFKIIYFGLLIYTGVKFISSVFRLFSVWNEHGSSYIPEYLMILPRIENGIYVIIYFIMLCLLTLGFVRKKWIFSIIVLGVILFLPFFTVYVYPLIERAIVIPWVQ